MRGGLKPHEVRELVNAITNVVTERFKTPQMTRDVIGGAVVDHLAANGLYVTETARDPIKGNIDPNNFEDCVSGFESMHSGRRLKKHNLRGTYTSPQIAALFNQHLRTIKWVISHANHDTEFGTPFKTCYGTEDAKCTNCKHFKKYQEIVEMPRYKRFAIQRQAVHLDSVTCIKNNHFYLE